MNTEQAVSHTILTPRRIAGHVLALVIGAGLLGLTFWLHTGARAVPGIIEDLQGHDLQAQMLAAQWLSESGEDARPAVPLLVDLALHHTNWLMRTSATAALRSVDLQAARRVMQESLPGLSDSDADVRRHTCSLLGSLGLLAKPAVPALIKMLADEDDLARERAIEALGAIGVPQTDVSAALTTALFDRSAMVRHRAVSLFAFAVPIPTTALAPLAGLQKDPDKTVASLARIALDRGGGVHRTDVQMLMARLQRRDGREDALQQLARLGPPAAEAVPAIIPFLNDRLPLHRYLAVEALGAIGPAAAQALSALGQTRADQDPVVRDAVADALRSIESAPLRNGGPP
ncbi:MAG: HEAT repeat domain-containing protein [Nitrospira sp.]|nr:HEAT repeat domain-containing protein [Nitrospira sp.]